MRVGLDARTLSVKGGSKTYAKNLIKRLKNKGGIELVLFGTNNEYFPGLEHINPRPHSKYFRPIWENISIYSYLYSEDIDIFHGLKNVVPRPCGNTNVVTIHDITFQNFSNLSIDRIYWKTFLGKYISRADKVVTISEASKRDILSEFNVSEDDVEIIYQGYNSDLFVPKNTNNSINELKVRYPKKSDIFDNFILNVGSFIQHKNQAAIIKAIQNIDYDTNLILVGKDLGYKKRLLKIIRKLGLKDKVHFLDYVPEDDLPYLYSASKVFCFPSIKEGFGLPPLEAMACGTPVITSNTSSLPEVVGNTGITVDPKDIDAISRSLERVIESNHLQDKLSKKGINRANKFSWKKTTNRTAKLYRSVYQ